MSDEDFGQFLPLLRRIIILLAVITAIPVVLWTITAFVRTYVAPPKIPTFHQLASTASVNERAPARSDHGSGVAERTAMAVVTPIKPAADTARAPAPTPMPSPVVAPPATAIDAAPKGPFLGDRPQETVASVRPASLAANSPASGALAAAGPAPVAPIDSKPAQAAAAPTVAATATPEAPQTVAVAVQESAPATERPVDAVPAGTPLVGPIPLPRRRPHVIAAEQPAERAPATQVTRLAANGPIPMPRPRPESAGPGAPAADTGGGSPLDFITNIFGGNK